MDAVPRLGDEARFGDGRVDPGAAAAQDIPDGVALVGGEDRVAALKFGGRLGQGRVAVDDRQAVEVAVRPEQIDDAPIGEEGHGQPRYPLQFGLVVERGGEDLARLGQEGQPPLRRLGRRARRPLRRQGQLLRLRPAAAGDVAEGDDRAGDLVPLADRGADVFDGKAAAVLAPEDVLVDPMDRAVAGRGLDRALLAWIGGTVRAGVVDQLVHLAADDLGRGVAGHRRRGGIDEGGVTGAIDAVDAVGGGGQDQLVLAQQAGVGVGGELALGDVAGEGEDEGAGRVIKRGQRQLDCQGTAVLAQRRQGDRPGGVDERAVAGGRVGGQANPVADIQVVGNEEVDRLADGLGGGVAEEGFGGGVPEDDAVGGGVADDDRVADAPEEQTDPKVLRPEGGRGRVLRRGAGRRKRHLDVRSLGYRRRAEFGRRLALVSLSSHIMARRPARSQPPSEGAREAKAALRMSDGAVRSAIPGSTRRLMVRWEGASTGGSDRSRRRAA